MSALSAAMSDVYENLIRLVDIHIERLVDLEDALDAELQATEASMLPVVSYHESLLFDDDETASESSDESEVYEPIIDDDEDMDNAVMSLSQLGLGNHSHVRFSDTVFEIGSPDRFASSVSSDRTVPMHYTPFDRRLVDRIHSSDSDDDSDSDTVVLEWIDPYESPSRFMTFDYDDDDYAIL